MNSSSKTSVATYAIILLLSLNFALSESTDDDMSEMETRGSTDKSEVMLKKVTELNIEYRLEQLIKCRIHKDEMTLSGLSTGGTFAQEVALAHSSYFMGLGIFAAFFYKCGDSSVNIQDYYSKCGKPGGFPITGFQYRPELIDPFKSMKIIKKYEKNGLIDPLSNLKPYKFFLWQGTVDQFIKMDVSTDIITIFEPLLRSPYQMHSVIQYSYHYFPTTNRGPPCSESSNPPKLQRFIGNCKYNGAYEMLNWLLSDPGFRLAQPNPLFDSPVLPLKEFNQTAFFYDIEEPIGMDDIGYVYIPKRCQRTISVCHVHFYFHGCFISRDFVGSSHIEGTGLLEVGEANGIIMVFPQNKKSSYNAEACFDVYGYTGENYANKMGKQIRIVRRMLDAFKKL